MLSLPLFNPIIIYRSCIIVVEGTFHYRDAKDLSSTDARGKSIDHSFEITKEVTKVSRGENDDDMEVAKKVEKDTPTESEEHMEIMFSRTIYSDSRKRGGVVSEFKDAYAKVRWTTRTFFEQAD